MGIDCRVFYKDVTRDFGFSGNFRGKNASIFLKLYPDKSILSVFSVVLMNRRTSTVQIE